jgi:hypothetical protein
MWLAQESSIASAGMGAASPDPGGKACEAAQSDSEAEGTAGPSNQIAAVLPVPKFEALPDVFCSDVSQRTGKLQCGLSRRRSCMCWGSQHGENHVLVVAVAETDHRYATARQEAAAGSTP